MEASLILYNISITMVLSKINSDISYPELKSVDSNDLDNDSNLYQIPIHRVEVVIAVGNAKRTYEKQRVLCFPIYLVKHNNKVIQIGMYEIKSTSSSKAYLKDGNLNIEPLEPLIYSFATKDFLLKNRLVPPEDDIKDEEEDEEDEKEKEELEEEEDEYIIPEIRKDIFVKIQGVPIPKMLSEESAKQAKDIRDKYRESDSDLWICTFMQNPKYGIQDNEGGGDCLFATIRDAFASIAQQTTVQKLRNKLADQVTSTIYNNYKETYDVLTASVASDTNNIKRLKNEYTLMQQKMVSVIDRDEKAMIVQQASQVKKEHDQLVKEKKMSSVLLGDYKFMKKVETMEAFKKIIKTPEFWADAWAISTLEHVLNIKLIILNSSVYHSTDEKNVLQCGQRVSDEAESFVPEFYIIVDYTGDHYKLISYKKKRIFKFTELPYDIKVLIHDKCMERNAGPFAMIPDFKKFKSSSLSRKGGGAKEYEDMTESKLRGLYNDDVVFQFYANSLDKPLPGKGNGEKIPNNVLISYSELATIPQWRKKLSNFWVQPFTLDNHSWASVEHYYQACKFKKTFPNFYLSFSLDSETKLSKDPAMAKAAGSKSGKFKGELLRPLEVEINEDFVKNPKKELYEAQSAKFSQHEDLKQMLLSTRNAKLTRYVKGDEPDVCDDLMLLRDKLMRSNA